MKVMKFGGSSLADAQRIRSVASIVREQKSGETAVVLSAMKGITDLLICIIPILCIPIITAIRIMTGIPIDPIL